MTTRRPTCARRRSSIPSRARCARRSPRRRRARREGEGERQGDVLEDVCRCPNVSLPTAANVRGQPLKSSPLVCPSTAARRAASPRRRCSRRAPEKRRRAATFPCRLTRRKSAKPTAPSTCTPSVTSAAVRSGSLGSRRKPANDATPDVNLRGRRRRTAARATARRRAPCTSPATTRCRRRRARNTRARQPR